MDRKNLGEFDIRSEQGYQYCVKCGEKHAFGRPVYTPAEYELVNDRTGYASASGLQYEPKYVLKFRECLAYACKRCGYKEYRECRDSPKKR